MIIVQFILRQNRYVVSFTVTKDISDGMLADFTLYIKSPSPTPDLYLKKYTAEKQEVVIDLRDVSMVIAMDN